MKTLEKLDRRLLWVVCVTILAVVVINFITSYGHIYSEGLKYGEYGTDARLMPIGIDGMLLALGLANVFAARFGRSHWLLRFGLAFGVAGTVAANGAYGAHWGMTGGLLSTWSPVALFITVESGLYMFRVAADIVKAEETRKAQEAQEKKPRVGRPPGSKDTAPRAKPRPKTPETLEALKTETEKGIYAGPEAPAVPVIRGRVDPLDPFNFLDDEAA